MYSMIQYVQCWGRGLIAEGWWRTVDPPRCPAPALNPRTPQTRASRLDSICPSFSARQSPPHLSYCSEDSPVSAPTSHKHVNIKCCLELFIARHLFIFLFFLFSVHHVNFIFYFFSLKKRDYKYYRDFLWIINIRLY